MFRILSRLNTELATLPWPITARPHPWPNCTEYFDEAFIFTVDDSTRDEQYFKLHMSTFIPLFSLMAYREHLGPPIRPGYSVALMPAVEDYSLQVCTVRCTVVVWYRQHFAWQEAKSQWYQTTVYVAPWNLEFVLLCRQWTGRQKLSSTPKDLEPCSRCFR